MTEVRIQDNKSTNLYDSFLQKPQVDLPLW